MCDSIKIELECGKCSGEGFINAFAHIADGRCFACGGSGVARLITQGEALRNAVTGLEYTAGIVLDAAAAGNTDRAHAYADSMIDDLFRVGTDAARKVLAFVAAGRYSDADSDRHATCSADVARSCRDYIVAAGQTRTA